MTAHTTTARNISHAILGTPPVWAANAIGTDQPNEAPSHTWGRCVNRLRNG